MNGSDLQHEVSTFSGRHSLTNAMVVGVYLRLMAMEEVVLATAWLGSAVQFEDGEMSLRSKGAYSRTPRPVTLLTLLPLSLAADSALRNDLDLIRTVVRDFSSKIDGEVELDAVVWVEVGEVVSPHAEERLDDIRQKLISCGDEGQVLLEELESWAPDAIIGWSAYASQRVQHVALPDGDAEKVRRATEWLQKVGNFLWVRDKLQLSTGEMNNISFASTAPGPDLLRDASMTLLRTRSKWRIGVIVPGGNAARSDIAELENHPEVECNLRVVPRSADNFASQMSTAVAAFQSGQDAVVIAYGGGSGEDLARVHAALEAHLESMAVPCWVAVGHASDSMEVANPEVRVCRTPSDARTLFLAETVEYEKGLRRILATQTRKLEGNREGQSAGRALGEALDELDATVKNARLRHLQGSRSRRK